ncbi:MAG: 50S ribosomal protein L20 [Phycisphaerales bacterium JB039]
MPRVRKGAARTQARKKLLREARGYYGARGNHKYLARNAVMRGRAFAYAHRRKRKRDMRSLWITRITAACRMRGTRYSAFMNGLRNAGVILNRKMLSQIAIEEPQVFDDLAKLAAEASRAVPAKA